ncbi:MAG: hypothetical protein KJT03_03685 [Verrucomicrobiae bacterium]|nr:hypothetical protein [Verrucomicrobiae bacterium]
MEIDSKKEILTQAKQESSRGWTLLYGIVVVALALQITFYAWLTKAFE